MPTARPTARPRSHLVLFDNAPENNRSTNTFIFDEGGVAGSWAFSFEARGPTTMLGSIVPHPRQPVIRRSSTPRRAETTLFNCADVEVHDGTACQGYGDLLEFRRRPDQRSGAWAWCWWPWAASRSPGVAAPQTRPRAHAR
jgi:hypothetical protein